ncbi:MAG: ABC transporter substrate-binding protein [Sandaracinaceae bacterium]|nr:ABC transporter substrate-binding protein [Sandaracinaceae bacterium]
MRKDPWTPIACVAALLVSAGAAALAPEARWEPRAASPPARPERIVSLALPADEIVLALADPSRVLALEQFADDPTASNVVREARAVRGRVRQPVAAEAILALEPDLVIVPAWMDPQIAALVEHQGIAVHRLRSPSSLAEVRLQIRELGAVIGEPEGAERLVAAMDARLEAVRARARPRSEAVLLAAWSGFTPARGTIFCELVELTGARCAAAEAGLTGYAPLSIEQLLALDPDVIVENRYRADAAAREVVAAPSFASDPRHRTLRAVRSGRVIDPPTAHLLATTHHVAALAEDLERALGPARSERR